MVAAQVAVFVRQHRQEARPVQRHEQRQTDGEVVDRAAQQTVAGQLLDAGVEFVVQINAVNRWPLDLAPDAFERIEQGRRLHGSDLGAARRIQPHPEGAQAGPEQSQSRQQQQNQPQAPAPLQQLRHHPGHQRRAQHQAAQYPGVAQGRESGYAAPVRTAVLGTGMLAQAHQVHKICLLHGCPPGCSCDRHLRACHHSIPPRAGRAMRMDARSGAQPIVLYGQATRQSRRCIAQPARRESQPGRALRRCPSLV